MAEIGPLRDTGRRRGERAHRAGVVVNSLLALLKIAGGLLSGSPALLADGYHSLADVATNGVAWLSFRAAAVPPDEDHHFGHGKMEAAAAVGIGLVLVLAGCSVLWQAMAANEWLVAITRRAADEVGSHALRALARDNRSDSLTSVLVLTAVGGALLGATWLEPVVTGAIGLLIVVMGLRSVREGSDVLLDRIADPDLRRRVEVLAEAVPGVRGVQRVAAHPIGSRLHVDLEVSVDGELSVRKGHEIAHEVESAVTRGESGVVLVSVHVNPAPDTGGEAGAPGG